MNSNLYQRALHDLQNSGRSYGGASLQLSDGGLLICAINKVAGRSITRGHHRTTWHLRPKGELYSIQISRTRATELLNEEVKK